MRSKLKLVSVCCLVLPAVQLFGQQFATNLSARFAPIPPCPVLVATARTNQILLEGIDDPMSNTNLNPGDTLTALVTLFEKNARRTQWLLYLQVVAPTAKEKAAKPPPPMTMPGLNGGKHVFASSPAWVSLRTLGPFAEAEPKRKPPKTQDKVARFVLNQGFLSLGFDRAAKVLQLAEAQKTNGLSSAKNPTTRMEVANAPKSKTNEVFSPEDERALMGTGPALMTYFEIMQHTAGLDDILFELVDLPSVWSMVRHVGVSASFQVPSGSVGTADPAAWSVRTTNSAYSFPMSLLLNSQPALNVTLVATAPQPPLLTCAGVVGVLAERPGDKEHYLTLRILSARRSKFPL